jgi:hypothetical protein
MSITDKQFEDSIYAAGLWFIGSYMDEFLSNEEILCELSERQKFARRLEKEGVSESMTRVDDVCRIIREGRTIEALERVIKSDKVNRDNPNSIVKAKQCRIPLHLVLLEIGHLIK